MDYTSNSTQNGNYSTYLNYRQLKSFMWTNLDSYSFYKKILSGW